ncbi:hypothetical protein JCM31598_11460 [Desulfonatronum parangueonense]
MLQDAILFERPEHLQDFIPCRAAVSLKFAIFNQVTETAKILKKMGKQQVV